MLITPANLNVFFTATEERFWQSYSVPQAFYNRITTTYPVGTENWLSGWLNMVDAMREWVGPRVVRTPAPQTYQVPIKPFELTEEIDRFKIEDDTHGIYYPMVANMGIQAAKAPDYQLVDLLQNAGSWTGGFQIGTDGLTHWNTAHPVDLYDASKGTYANDYTNGGVVVGGINVGGALAANSFATVWEDMAARKSESGKAQDINPGLMVCPTQLKATAQHILEAGFMGLPVIGNLGTGTISAAGSSANANQVLVGASENMFKSWSELAVWKDLVSTTAIGGGTYQQVWYLLDIDKPIKPFSHLFRMGPEFAFQVDPDNPIVFATHKFVYGVVMRFAMAWAPPFLSSRSSP